MALAQEGSAKPQAPAEIQLPSLYLEVGKELQQILTGDERWAVLPKPITKVHAQPDGTPVFESQTLAGIYDVSSLQRTMLLSLAHDWKGQFHLLSNGQFRARAGDQLWTSLAGPAEFKLIEDGRATTYNPLGRIEDAARALASAGGGSWWMASGSGLFLTERATLRRETLPDWPPGGVAGVVSDGKGRVVAWSQRQRAAGTAIALLEKGKWTTLQANGAFQWEGAALRTDGHVLL